MSGAGSNGDIYYVEKILDKQTIRGVVKYLIKWQDYDATNNSWEPEENLTPELIHDFQKEREERKKNKNKKPAIKKKKEVAAVSVITTPAEVNGGGTVVSSIVESTPPPVLSLQVSSAASASAPLPGPSAKKDKAEGKEREEEMKENLKVDRPSSSSSSKKEGSEERRKEKDLEILTKHPNGFERGLKPERIIGATPAYGETMFLMKWKNVEDAELIPARIANIECPQKVIKFYERSLAWATASSEDDECEEASQQS